jgi:hypothetical protein
LGAKSRCSRSGLRYTEQTRPSGEDKDFASTLIGAVDRELFRLADAPQFLPCCGSSTQRNPRPVVTALK